MTKFIEMTNEEIINVDGGGTVKQWVSAANVFVSGYAAGSSSTNCPVIGAVRGTTVGILTGTVSYIMAR